jgi:hypothetical protein
MSPDEELTINAYQQGQRAYRTGVPCPYSDWRAEAWAKGYAAGEAYYNSPMYYNIPIDSEPEHEVESTFQTLKEEISELRKEVEYLRKKVDDLEYMEWLMEGSGEDYL